MNIHTLHDAYVGEKYRWTLHRRTPYISILDVFSTRYVSFLFLWRRCGFSRVHIIIWYYRVFVCLFFTIIRTDYYYYLIWTIIHWRFLFLFVCRRVRFPSGLCFSTLSPRHELDCNTSIKIHELLNEFYQLLQQKAPRFRCRLLYRKICAKSLYVTMEKNSGSA